MSIPQILILSFAIYLFACFLMYLVQERFLFHPERLDPDFEFKYKEGEYEELFFEPEPGVSVNGLHFKSGGDKGLLLYFHGNTRSMKGWGKIAIDFTKLGYDVVMIDYRGFGKSQGHRTEKGLKSDAQYVYNSLLKQWPEEKVVVYGRSMGTGFATKIASNNNPRLLVLEAPYYSMTDTASRFLFFFPVAFLLRYTVQTNEWMKYVQCPTVIIHGKNDRLIPWRAGERLANIHKKQTRFFLVPKAGHNNLGDFPVFHRIIEEVLG